MGELDKHVEELKQKRYHLRSMRMYSNYARKALEEKKYFDRSKVLDVTEILFNLLITIEQTQQYLVRELDKELKAHGQTTVNGTVTCDHTECLELPEGCKFRLDREMLIRKEIERILDLKLISTIIPEGAEMKCPFCDSFKPFEAHPEASLMRHISTEHRDKYKTKVDLLLELVSTGGKNL